MLISIGFFITRFKNNILAAARLFAILLFVCGSVGSAAATPFTTTVPGTNVQIPGNYPEAGGIVLVLQGANGNFYFQISNPSGMMVGFQDRPTTQGNSTQPQNFRGTPDWQIAPEYTVDCGTATCNQYFGGGIVAGWVRFTAFDGDTSPTGGGNFDLNDIELLLTDTPNTTGPTGPVNFAGSAVIGNWSDPATETTSLDGTVATETRIGYPNGAFSTGWFPINSQAVLDSFLVPDRIVRWGARDADPGDNFWNFTLGFDADTSVVPERVAPGIEFTKSALTANFQAIGDTVDYEFEVENIGTVFIDNIAITDDQIASVSCPLTRLDPGQSMTCTATDTVTQADLDAGGIFNTATVSGTPQAGSLGPVTDTAFVPAINQSSTLDIQKSDPTNNDADGSGGVSLNDVLTYVITATNTGTLTQTDVIVSDTLITPGAITCPSLAPGAMCVLTGSLTVSQAQVDAGLITNTGQVISDDQTTPLEASVTTPVDQLSGLSIDKRALTGSYSAVGDTLSYEFEVINRGTVTITSAITISDDRIGTVTCPALPAGGLGPNQALICSASDTVSQADLNAGSVTNTASASDGTTVSPTDSATVNAVQTNGLELSKTATPQTYSAVGETINYAYIVTNTGNVTVTEPISIADDQVNVTCPSLPAGGLAPTASLTCSASDTITQLDIDAGALTNAATATDGTTLSAQVSETVTATQTPGLSLAKTALASSFAAVGDTLNYEYVITNSGNTTLTNVLTITDDRIAAVSCPSLPAGGLAPGATLTCTGQDMVTQADIDAGSVTNIATVSDGTNTSAPATQTVEADQDPGLTVLKTADASGVSNPAQIGETILYTITAENSGNVTLSSVTISDALLGGDITTDCTFPTTTGVLDVGEVATCSSSYQVTQADIDAGDVVNTASADATDPAGDPVTDEIDDPVTTPLGQAPGFDVVKTATDINFALPGDVVTYEYVVTNSGNTTITEPVAVSDNLISSVSCPALPVGGLLPGASLTCDATYQVTQSNLDAGSVTNLASATDGITTSPLTSETIPADQNPALSLVKTSPDSDFSTVGDVLTYTFEVQNTGNLTLTGDIEVTDDRIGTFVCFTGNLVPGGSETCSRTDIVDQADLDAGSVTNQAFATNGALTAPPVSVTLPAVQTPQLDFDKRSLSASFSAPGETLIYEYDVTNSGNVTISSIVLTDDRIASISCPLTQLAPGQNMICTATDTVTQTDIDTGSVTNIAGVTGIPAGGILAPQTDTVTVSADQMPVLDFVKTALNGSFGTVGDILEYQYRVENTGNVTIDSLVVSDDQIASVTCPVSSLAPGQVTVCSGQDVVTQADLDAGFVTNIAEVNGNPAGGVLAPESDTATVSANQVEGLAIVKAANQTDFAVVGDVIDYTYTVTNTGNVTVTDPVSVSDDRVSVTCQGLPVGGLAPGASLTCIASDTVSQADLDAGFVTNTANAISGAISSVPDSVTVNGTQTPSLDLIKAAVTADYDADGDFIDYTYTVTNTGNITLAGPVSVTDNLIASVNCPATGTDGLAPGETIVCTARYWVTQADVDAGSVTNLASASADGTSSPQVSETVSAVQAPSLDLLKAASPSVYSAPNDVIEYTYTVTNSGNVTVTDAISVSDDQISVTCPALPTGGLAPGASLTCTASDTITQADIDAGSLTNTASASDGTTSSAPVSETVVADQRSGFDIVKTPDVVVFDNPGDVSTYLYTVTNTGNVTVTAPIVVTDNLIPVVNCQALPAGGLLPGDSVTCTASYAATQADLDLGSVTNIASASDGTTTSAPTSATIPVNAQPALITTKTALTTDYAAAGDVLSYEYTVRNNGNVTLTGTTNVEDDLIGTIACFTGNLAPGMTVTCNADYAATQADVDAGFVTNVAFSQNGAVSSPVVDETVNGTQTPGLTLLKVADQDSFAAVGDVLTYTYTVTNSGNTTITAPIVVSDSRIPSVTCPALPTGGLAPDGVLVCTGQDSVSQADIDAGMVDNTASASDGTINSAPMTVSVPAAQNRSLDLMKTAVSASYAAVGDVLEYEYLLTNTGNTTLQGAPSINDDRINVTCPALPTGGLAPDGQLTCTGQETVTQALIDIGTVTNVATGSVGPITSDPDTVTITGAQAPQLQVLKSVDTSNLSSPVQANDVLTYTILVENTGNVSLSDVSVVDTLLGGDITSTCVFPAQQGDLAVGSRAVCTEAYVITQSDVDAGGVMNTATATATDPADNSVSDVSDAGNPAVETPGLNGETDGDPTNDPTLTMFGASPSLAIDKRAMTTTFAVVGDRLRYEYDVTNTGNTTLTVPIIVTDDRIASVICPALPSGGLLPNDSIICEGEDIVTQADLDLGEVINIASATSGGTRSPDVTARVEATQTPGLRLEKIVDEPVQVAGSIFDVNYTVTIVNTGNVTLTDIAIVDDLASAFAPATLSGQPSLSFTGFSGTGALNNAYDGVTTLNLLLGDVQLDVGQTATIEIAAQVDIATGTPGGGNTAVGTSAQTPDPVPSDDPTVTPENSGDVNPTPLNIVDTDGDGVPDGVESSTEDRDGDGIPDAEDYDPTGYFYCQESGAILTGGQVTITGPAGSNSALGTANNITIVADGTDGFYQFFVSAPGRYTVVPTYPLTGEPSTDRLPQEGAFDATSALPSNPALLGSTEFGATGQLADFSETTNTPFFFEFDLEPGDPAIFANNIPLQSCGVPAGEITKTVIGDPVRQPDGRVQITYEFTVENTGQTGLENIRIEDDLSQVFGIGAVETVSVEVINAPDTFVGTANADFNGDADIDLLVGDSSMWPDESLTVQLVILADIQEAGDYTNTATLVASPPLADDPGLIAPNSGLDITATDSASLTIEAISDPSQLLVTKTARPSIVQIGDAVRFQITVENQSTSPMADLRVVDRPPAGLSFVPGSAVFSLPSGESLVLDPDLVSRGQLAWTLNAAAAAPFDVLAPGDVLTLDLSMVANSAAEFGELTNTAFVEDVLTGNTSLLATAVVEFIPEPTFDCTPVLGRVFEDVNANGYMDEGEPGLPGVRLNTVNGDIITTDDEGRYHIPCAIVPDNERGSNYILKTDVRTLPLGYVMTTENPRVLRATRGKFIKMNFGAIHRETQRIDLSVADFGDDGALRTQLSVPLLEEGEARRLLIVYRAAGDEAVSEARSRLATVREALGRRAKGTGFEITYVRQAAEEDTTEDAPYRGALIEGPHIDRRIGGDEGPEPDPSQLDRGGQIEEGYKPGDVSASVAGLIYRDAPTIETSVDALHISKQLSLSTHLAADENGHRVLLANGFWNYGYWIERAELRLFGVNDTVRGTPQTVVPLDAYGSVAVALDDALEDDLSAVLRVYDKKGRFDETRPRLVRVVEAEDLQTLEEADDEASESFGADAIAFSNIPVNGATVRVYGRNVSGQTAEVFGQVIEVDGNGRFVAEAILPDGDQTIDVTTLNERVIRDITVKTRDFEGVGLFEATVGNRRSGDGVNAEGRAAFYIRGRLSPRIRITATADTGEAGFDDLFDQFDERDSRSLLRRLDPDKFYPVYGDDSTIEEDAPTSGRFYVRLERDDDYIVWGNYRTNFNDTEFARVERTLYGAKLHWDETGNPTRFGDARTSVDAFLSDPGTRSARDELRGTGGSVYFLRNADISIGSDIVRVETRDVISGIVLESRLLTYGDDYDIDYLQGRIILNQPLSSTSEDGRLFADGSLSGDEVFLVVEYEFTGDLADFDALAFGARGTRWFGDHLKLGATFARDIQAGAETDTYGADLTLQITGETFVKAEVALTDGLGLSAFRSLDGGLTFEQRAIAGASEDPLAFLIEARTKFSDFGWGEGTASVYFRSREAGFAGFGEQTLDDATQYGFALDTPVTDKVSFKAQGDVVQGGFSGERSVVEASVSANVTDALTLTTGISYQDTFQFDDSLAVAVRADYAFDDINRVYAFAQTGISGSGNEALTDRAGIGGELRLNDKLSAGGEISSGAAGLGSQFSIRYAKDEFSETYLTYDLPTRANVGERAGGLSNAQGGLTIGGRRRLTDSISIFGEDRRRFGSNENGFAGRTQAFGVEYNPNEAWTFGFTGEFGTVGQFDRESVSLTGGFKKGVFSAGATAEARFDENEETGEQLDAFLLRANAQAQLTEGLRLQGKVNYADADGSVVGGAGSIPAAKFTEASIAAAYRPVQHDRLNLLAKLVYLEDLSPAGQRLNGDILDFRQRSTIISLDGTYDVTQRCSVGAKYGFRSGEVTEGRESTDFFSSQAWLGVGRLDCNIVNKWDGLLEGRYLNIGNGISEQWGGLAGVYRNIGNNLKLGGGVTWGGIEEEFVALNAQDDFGWFINVVTKF